MGLRRYVCFIRTITWEPVYWESLDRNKAREFVENCKTIPESKTYPKKEWLLDDIERAVGIITFPVDENEEFLEWFEDLIAESM